jgi:Glycosyl hydrolase family 12
MHTFTFNNDDGYAASRVNSHDGNPASFSVTLNADPTNTVVNGYPSVQCLMYSALPPKLTSSFRITPPVQSQGLDYEYAYDVWLTTATKATQADPNWDGDYELMIWNYRVKQEPSGSITHTLPDGSKVWTDSGMVSVVLPRNITTGTVDIGAIIKQLKGLGVISSSLNGVLDVEYGIEGPYGAGKTFTVNSLSVAT